MYRFRCTKDFSRAGVEVSRGREYLVEDINAGELLCHELGVVSDHFDPAPTRILDSIDDDHGLLIVRPGGFGDLLFLTPIISELRRFQPVLRIGVCAFPKYLPVLEGIGVELIPYPFHDWDADEWAAFAFLENVVERDPIGKELHIVDAMASRLPIKIGIADYTLKYRVTPKEAIEAQERFPRNKKQRVGVQLRASSEARTYPAVPMGSVLYALEQEGVELVLFGAPGELRQPVPDGIINLTMQDPPLTMRESIAVLQTCDAVIAPDSAIAHFAAALEIPCVALYASFPWNLRTLPYPTTRALTGLAPCAPCFHHDRGGRRFPEGAVCNEARYCIAMGNIQPERIVAEVKKMLREKESPCPF